MEKATVGSNKNIKPSLAYFNQLKDAQEATNINKCGNRLSCSICLENEECVWCPLEQKCVKGNMSGSLDETCKIFYEFGQCSSIECKLLENCENCIKHSECSWCADPEVPSSSRIGWLSNDPENIKNTQTQKISCFNKHKTLLFNQTCKNIIKQLPYLNNYDYKNICSINSDKLLDIDKGRINLKNDLKIFLSHN